MPSLLGAGPTHFPPKPPFHPPHETTNMDTTPDTTAAPTPTVTYKPANGVAVVIPGYGAVPAAGIVSPGIIERLDIFVGSLLVKLEGELATVEQATVGALVDKVEAEAKTVVTEVKAEVAAVEAKVESGIARMRGLFHRGATSDAAPADVAPGTDSAAPAADPAAAPATPAE